MKKYYIHREGRRSILFVGILLILIGAVFTFFCKNLVGVIVFLSVEVIAWAAVISFFRIPKRQYPSHEKRNIVSPADGVIVDVSKVKDPEYFDDERIRISVFMSPANVHVNRYPVDGIVRYRKYHPGRYLVAWHPKSSTQNERNTIVLETEGGEDVLVRQIAGAVARRIVSYAKVGDSVVQGQELGFIKFGSRVDLLLPLGAEIKVEMEEKVKGGVTIIAEL